VVPELDEPTTAQLKDALVAAAAFTNPVDLTADGTAASSKKRSKSSSTILLLTP